VNEWVHTTCNAQAYFKSNAAFRPKALRNLMFGANRNDECVLHLVLIQQRQDSDDMQSNSRANWPELQSFRQKLKYYERRNY